MSSHWTVCVCERMVFFSVMRILDLHFLTYLFIHVFVGVWILCFVESIFISYNDFADSFLRHQTDCYLYDLLQFSVHVCFSFRLVCVYWFLILQSWLVGCGWSLFPCSFFVCFGSTSPKRLERLRTFGMLVWCVHGACVLVMALRSIHLGECLLRQQSWVHLSATV
jgi:hypothetical protein